MFSLILKVFACVGNCSWRGSSKSCFCAPSFQPKAYACNLQDWKRVIVPKAVSQQNTLRSCSAALPYWCIVTELWTVRITAGLWKHSIAGRFLAIYTSVLCTNARVVAFPKGFGGCDVMHEPDVSQRWSLRERRASSLNKIKLAFSRSWCAVFAVNFRQLGYITRRVTSSSIESC